MTTCNKYCCGVFKYIEERCPGLHADLTAALQMTEEDIEVNLPRLAGYGLGLPKFDNSEGDNNEG